MAADALGVRMAHLEGAYEQIDKRLGSLEGEVRDLRHELHDQFRWIVGLLIVAIFSPMLSLLVVAILSPAVLRLLGH
jgi:hypothetical protein